MKEQKETPDRINRIKIVLAEKDISQKYLAEKLNVNVNTISNICNNLTQPHLTVLKDIAKILDVDIRDLLLPTK